MPMQWGPHRNSSLLVANGQVLPFTYDNRVDLPTLHRA
jgi:hypothetical protein